MKYFRDSKGKCLQVYLHLWKLYVKKSKEIHLCPAIRITKSAYIQLSRKWDHPLLWISSCITREGNDIFLIKPWEDLWNISAPNFNRDFLLGLRTPLKRSIETACLGNLSATFVSLNFCMSYLIGDAIVNHAVAN